MVSLIMYKYRIYPSSKQKIRLINSFKTCKIIYNELLAMSIDAYKYGKVSFTAIDYTYYLAYKYPEIYSRVRDNVAGRVHKAFQNFFRRVKSNERKKGFPRFKSRVNSVNYSQGFKFISDKRLKLSKIGIIPIILHRVPKGKIKDVTIKQNSANQWFATFCCEIRNKNIVHLYKEKIGIDVGLENFATLSNGETISNPRFLIKSEKRLKQLHRQLFRKKKGSKNRNKAKSKLAKQHLKVANQRTDFLHKLSRNLVFKYSIIAVEDLSINKMVKNHIFAKSISDASWNIFFNMLSYKAVRCGGQLLKNAKTRGSSHRCSDCGFYVENMPLSKRIFSCPECGNIKHRDHNAAINHKKDTVGLTEISTPVDDCVRPSSKATVCESGTINGKTSS